MLRIAEHRFNSQFYNAINQRPQIQFLKALD